MWTSLNMTNREHRPEEDTLVVLKIVDTCGSVRYDVGRFRRDRNDPTARKFWWHSGNGGTTDPANWKKRGYRVEWVPVLASFEEVC